MDKIDFAINNNWHISEDETINAQEWSEFEKVSHNKQIAIYGVGNGAEWFFIRNRDKYDISMVVDQNESIQGDIAGAHVFEMRHFKKYNDIWIGSPQLLFESDDKNMVIVISSLMHFWDIAKELDRCGFHNYYAVLPMEANHRKNNQIKENKDWMERFVDDAMEHEVRNNKIVFTSVVDYSGNGRAIADNLAKLEKNIDMVWIVKGKGENIPSYIRAVQYEDRIHAVHEMETARVLIDDNCALPQWFKKREGQIYIQVKHWGSLVLKYFSRDEGVFRGDLQQIRMHERDGEMMDYVITGSDLDTKTCLSGFAFSKEVWQIGSPRSDVFFRPDEAIKRVHSHYCMQDEKKALLYAPTFRYSKLKPEATFVDMDYELIKDSLEKRFGGEWVILLRLHPAVAKESSKIIHPEYVIDVSGYQESTDLVAAADAMVTDYSSMMFDSALMKKPVFLYVPDREDYVAKQRALHLSFDELPFSFAESNNELGEDILKFNKKEYIEKLCLFIEKYNVCDDGNAGIRAAERIVRLID